MSRLEMRTIELFVGAVAVFGVYGIYLYYLLNIGARPSQINIWFLIGYFIDMFLFNNGVKPKKEIQDAPNRILEWITGNPVDEDGDNAPFDPLDHLLHIRDDVTAIKMIKK